MLDVRQLLQQFDHIWVGKAVSLWATDRHCTAFVPLKLIYPLAYVNLKNLSNAHLPSTQWMSL